MRVMVRVQERRASQDRCDRYRRKFVLGGSPAKAKQFPFIVLVFLVFSFPLRAQDHPVETQAEQLVRQSADEAPPVKEFHKDLARNFGALFSGDNVRPLVVGAAVTAAAIPVDDRITGFFKDTSHWQGFDTLGKQIGKSQLLGPAIGLSFLVSRTTENTDFQRFTYSLAQGFIVSNTLTGGVKVITNRERPDRTSHTAFPSGHTSNSFMWATVVSQHYGWQAGVPAYALASYVGASRLKSRKHYLTDVLAGAVLGYIVGRTVTRDRASQEHRRLRWGVAVPPGGGAAFSLAIRPW